MTTFVSGTLSWGDDNGGMTNAVFQNRCLQIFDTIIASGVVQTADTGQLNLATATRPGNWAMAGYHIYRFNDSRQGVDPLFFKVWYGCAENVARMGLLVQTGTGTNGAGTLTGQLSSQRRVGASGVQMGSTANQGTNFSCHTDGWFYLAMQAGNTVSITPILSFAIERTKNSGGSFDSLGNVLHVMGAAGDFAGSNRNLMFNQFTRTGNNVFTGADNAHICAVPGEPSTSAALNGDKQLYPHWYADPAVNSSWATFTVRNNEFVVAPNTFTAAPKFAQQRTFLFLGTNIAPVAIPNYNTVWRAAFLWE